MDDQGVALARAVHEETDGNPFFVSEVTRHLLDNLHAADGIAAHRGPRRPEAGARSTAEISGTGGGPSESTS